MSKMTITEYKKSKETPAIREWKQKWNGFYYSYADAVLQYEAQMITFEGFMKILKILNRKWIKLGKK